MPDKRRSRNTFAAALWALTAACFSPAALAASPDDSLFDTLTQAAPQLNPQVLASALQATQCAVTYGTAMPQRLAVIDFSLPSSDKRMWVFDLQQGKLLMHELVAHGRRSGERESNHFSNVINSHSSSIGLFRASESYRGKHGYSLRLDGLEPGVNDKARERAIVIHGADYVGDDWIENYGRIGRSHGCPAVRQEVVQQVVDTLKGGQLVFKYFPDQDWLQSSRYLHCDDPQIGKLVATADSNS